MIHNYGYLLITLITQDKTLVDDIKNATQVEVATATNHDNSRVINLRQKMVIIDYNTVPVILEELKDWSDNSQFLILLLEENHPEIISEFQEYISDVWYKPLNSVILAKRLSMLSLFSSEAKDVSEYIGWLSFEIKNPIASILGYSNILLSGKYLEPLTETQNEFVSIINLNASRMRYLIDNLKYDFQIKYGVFTLNFDRIKIDAILKYIIEKINPFSIFDEPLYKFELITEGNLPNIYADELRLNHVIEMLLISAKLENSIQTKLTIFQENNFIKFSLSSEKAFVSENSNGFYLSSIPFGETTISHIVERHNGQIHIESNHETGSTFSFTIPIAKNYEV